MIPLPSENVTKYIYPAIGIVAIGGLIYIGNRILTKDEIPKLKKNPSVPDSSLSSVEAQAITETLYIAMQSAFAANDKETKTILNTLNGLTQNDFVKVYDAFGARQYSLFWKNVGDPFTSDDHSLLTWLSNELSEENFRKISQIIPEALQYQKTA
ncbi:hypothetical protein [Zunongwangia sp.]|uniref:hypothetical protein n=1 Tax=Zunongwangia sp. TaxID=1965325 RepID=UPI003AA80BAD